LHYDARFYVENQIQNPVAQLFALCIEQLEGYKPPAVPYTAVFDRLRETIAKKQPTLNSNELDEEATLSVLKQKEKVLDGMMFVGSPELQAMVRKRGHSMVKGPLDAFFAKK
jgi:hypothetical protein